MKVVSWSKVRLHILMEVSMLVESYRDAKIRIMLTVYSYNWYQEQGLVVLLIHIMALLFLLDPLLVWIIIAFTCVHVRLKWNERIRMMIN